MLDKAGGNANVHALWRWLAVVLWMGVIFAVSDMPPVVTHFKAGHDFTFKKLAHVVEYGILTVLLFSAVRIQVRHKGFALLSAALVAILYAGSDEWHQTFVPGREGTLRDVVIDAVGAVAVSLWLRSKSEAKEEWVNGKR